MLERSCLGPGGQRREALLLGCGPSVFATEKSHGSLLWLMMTFPLGNDYHSAE